MVGTNNLISPTEIFIDVGGRFTPWNLTPAQESSLERALKDPSLERIIGEYGAVKCKNSGDNSEDERITLEDKRLIFWDYGFWFSVYGLKPCYRIDIVDLSFQDKEGRQCVHHISVYARGFFRDFSKKVEEDNSYLKLHPAGLVKDHSLRSGKTLDEILLTNEMELYLFQEDDAPAVKIKLDSAPHPIKFIPQYIPRWAFVFHPAESLTQKEINEAATKYCHYLLGLPFCNFTYINPYDESNTSAK